MIEMEQVLTTYGPLGAWTLWLLYEKKSLLSRFNDTLIKFQSVMQDNTEALKNVCILIKQK